MKNIKFLVYNIYGIGGTVRATLNTASYLAENGYDVEIVSVKRSNRVPMLSVSSKVTLSFLWDRTSKLSSDSSNKSLASKLSGLLFRVVSKFLIRFPSITRSRLYLSEDDLYKNFNTYTDIKLLKYLIGVRDCILITTTPSLNLMSLKFVHKSVVKVGQEHKIFETHPALIRDKIRSKYHGFDAITCITKEAYAKYADFFCGSNVDVWYMPNGTSFPELNKFVQRENFILAAGRMDNKTNFSGLIRIFSKISGRHPGWRLKIYGDGDSYKINLLSVCEYEGVQDRVDLMPKTGDLSSQYRAASIYALSAPFEPFGMVLIEAMAHECPCVAFESQGPSQIIKNGHTGVLVESGRDDIFAEKLSFLISDAELRQQMGREARESIKEYDIDRVGGKWARMLSSYI